MPRNGARLLASGVQRLPVGARRTNVKVLVYRGMLALLLEVALPVYAYLGGYRPGRRRGASS